MIITVLTQFLNSKIEFFGVLNFTIFAKMTFNYFFYKWKSFILHLKTKLNALL